MCDLAIHWSEEFPPQSVFLVIFSPHQTDSSTRDQYEVEAHWVQNEAIVNKFLTGAC